MAWGKVRRTAALVRDLATYALDTLAPEHPARRSLRTLTAEVLFARSERAAKINNDVEALFVYRDPLVRRLVWEMKYHSSPRAIALAADCLIAYLTEELAERALLNALAKPVLVSIPASPERTRERGGDPLALVSSRVASATSGLCTYAPYTLYKIRDTRPQTTLTSHAERLRNVVGSFKVRKDVSVRGHDVIVLDDVTTTGATFAEARRALHAAGARKIFCVALAH